MPAKPKLNPQYDSPLPRLKARHKHAVPVTVPTTPQLAFFASPCEHKFDRDCSLTSTHACCACADTRPIAETYEIYVDGIGVSSTPHRWQHYCPGCRKQLSQVPCHHKLRIGCKLSMADCCICADKRSARDSPDQWKAYCPSCKTHRRKQQLQRQQEHATATQRQQASDDSVINHHKQSSIGTAVALPPGKIGEASEQLRSPCVHKTERKCSLNAIPDCCACADQRPEEHYYENYVDGEGLVKRSARYNDYCPGCREYFEPFKPLPASTRMYAVKKKTTAVARALGADSYTYEPAPSPASENTPDIKLRTGFWQRLFGRKTHSANSSSSSMPSSSRNPLPGNSSAAAAKTSIPKHIEATQHEPLSALDEVDPPPAYTQYKVLPMTDYSVAWLVGSAVEARIALAALDETHDAPLESELDPVRLYFGAIHGRNVAIAHPAQPVCDGMKALKMARFLCETLPALKQRIVVTTVWVPASASVVIRRGDIITMPGSPLKDLLVNRIQRIGDRVAVMRGEASKEGVRNAVDVASIDDKAFAQTHERISARVQQVRGEKRLTRMALELLDEEDELDEHGDVIVQPPRSSAVPRVHCEPRAHGVTEMIETAFQRSSDQEPFRVLDAGSTVATVAGVAAYLKDRDHEGWHVIAMTAAVAFAVQLTERLG